MTVKELKERLELLIEDGKEDYTVFVDDLVEECEFYVSDKHEVVYIMSDDRYVAFVLLSRKVGHVLANKELFPRDIFAICCDYVFGGCKNRSDYEYMVNFLIDNEEVREELLK